MPIVATFLCSLTFFLEIGPCPLLLYRMGRGECGSALESVNFPRVITVIWTQDLAAEKREWGLGVSWLYERASISPTKTRKEKKPPWLILRVLHYRGTTYSHEKRKGKRRVPNLHFWLSRTPHHSFPLFWRRGEKMILRLFPSFLFFLAHKRGRGKEKSK